MIGRLTAAWRGRSLWARLSRRHDVERGAYVIVFPEDDADLNDVALAHVGDLVADRRARGVVVVTAGRRVAERARGLDGVLAVEVLGDADIDALLSFQELYQFSPRILFVSLTRPYANHLSRMVGVAGLTLDDLICLSMYRIRGWSGEGVARAERG